MRKNIKKLLLLPLVSLLGLTTIPNFISETKAENEYTEYSLDDLEIDGFKQGKINVFSNSTSEGAVENSKDLAEKSIVNLRYKSYNSGDACKNFHITVGGYGIYVSNSATLRFIYLTYNSEQKTYSRAYQDGYTDLILKDSEGNKLTDKIEGGKYFSDYVDGKFTFDLSGEYGKVAYELTYKDIVYRPYTSGGQLVETVTFTHKPKNISDRKFRAGNVGIGNFLYAGKDDLENDPTARKEYSFNAEQIYTLANKNTMVQTDLTLSEDKSNVLFHCNVETGVDPYVYFEGKILAMSTKFDSIKLEYKLGKDISTQFNFYSFYGTNGGKHTHSDSVKYVYSEDFQFVTSFLPNINGEKAVHFRIDYVCTTTANDVYIKSMTFFNADGSYSPGVVEGEIFTNNEQFSFVGSNAKIISKKDAPEGVLNAELLEMSGSTSNTVTFDFRQSALNLDDYGKITFRVYSKGTPNSTYPEFRVQRPGESSWLVIGEGDFRGAGGISLVKVNNSWYEISFGSSVVCDKENQNIIGQFNVIYRTQVASDTLYIDSIKLDKIERKTFPFSFIADNEIHNNTPMTGGNRTILVFGTTHIDYFGSGPDGTNLSYKGNRTAEGITINGKKIYEYKNTVVDYSQGYNYLHLVLPDVVNYPSNGYKVTTLHIEEGTPFVDNRLGEVTLYLVNGKWTTLEPELTDETSYYSLLDLFNIDACIINNEVLENNSDKDLTQGFLFKVVSNFNEIDGKIIATIFEKYTFTISKNEIHLIYGISDELTKTKIFNNSEFLLEFSVEVGTKLTFKLGLDGVVILKRILTKPSEIESLFSLTATNGIEFKNYSGGNYRGPIISNSGSKYFYRQAGDTPIDFTNIVTAYDIEDGDLSNELKFIYPEAAVISNKLVAGEWKIIAKVTDSDDNESTLTIYLVVYGATGEISVTFNGTNLTTYHLGDKVNKPVDPTKESDYQFVYEFDGWYVGEYKWDFENDTLSENTNFEAKFNKKNREYTITIKFEGIEKTPITLYAIYGAKLNLTIFEIEGYKLEAYIENVKVDKVIVNSDKEITLKYIEIIPEPIHEHTYSETWSSDGLSHWHQATCEHTNLTSDFANHTFVNGVCSVCGYIDPNYKPVEPVEPDKPDEKKGCGGSIIASASIVSVVALLGCALLFVKKEEK